MATKVERLDERIAALQAKLDQEKARKQKIEAQQRASEQKRTRTLENKQKILVGAAILQKVKNGEWPKDRLIDMMDKFLTRPHERAAFDLPPLKSQGASHEATP